MRPNMTVGGNFVI